MPIISLMNQKGGVAKTTTAVNLSAALSIEYKVLMIDLDAQANLSDTYKSENSENSVIQLFKRKSFEPIKLTENLYIIPSHEDFTGMEVAIADKMAREYILEKALKPYKDQFDYIIIDCPSNPSYITLNGLSCSDYAIIPVESSHYGTTGINKMVNTITEVRDMLNPNLKILGVLITIYEGSLNISKSVLEKFKENGWDAALFDTKIRKNTKIKESQEAQSTIFQYDSKCNGAIDYKAFTKEVINKTQK